MRLRSRIRIVRGIDMRFPSLTNRWRDPCSRLPHVMSNTLTVRSVAMLRKAFGWTKESHLIGDHLEKFDYLEDLNDRRLRDAEIIATVCANFPARNIVEIGTAAGRTTALMAVNAPEATIHTVNIDPADIAKGGRFTTYAPSLDEIGLEYRNLGLKNIRQILANTANWCPDISPIDIAFIDGSHDADFVCNDTRLLLKHAVPGSILMWHDFAPDLCRVYPWIAEVCLGVEHLYRKNLIQGRILHVQDSWIGLYCVGDS